MTSSSNVFDQFSWIYFLSQSCRYIPSVTLMYF